MLGLDTGAAEVPAALDVETDFEVKARGFLEGVAIELAPARGAEHGAGGDHAVALLLAAVGVHEEGSAVAFGGHLLEVARDGSLVGVAVEPPPVAAESGFLRRVSKARGQRIGRLRLDEQRYGDREKEG